PAPCSISPCAVPGLVRSPGRRSFTPTMGSKFCTTLHDVIGKQQLLSVEFAGETPQRPATEPLQQRRRHGIDFASRFGVRYFLCAVLFFADALAGVQSAPAPLAEFPFEFREGLLWIEVSVPQSKAPLSFLMDTGAGVSVINLSTAKRIGLKLG